MKGPHRKAQIRESTLGVRPWGSRGLGDVPETPSQSSGIWAPLTVPAAGEEGHAVDGDRHGAVLAVEVVDVVGGAEAGRDPGPLGRPQQQQQPQ